MGRKLVTGPEKKTGADYSAKYRGEQARERGDEWYDDEATRKRISNAKCDAARSSSEMDEKRAATKERVSHVVFLQCNVRMSGLLWKLHL